MLMDLKAFTIRKGYCTLGFLGIAGVMLLGTLGMFFLHAKQVLFLRVSTEYLPLTYHLGVLSLELEKQEIPTGHFR